MFASTHIIWGGLSGSVSYRVLQKTPTWLIFLGAMLFGQASHFLLDSVPHAEYDGLGYFDLPLYAILIPEMLFFGLLTYIAGCGPNHEDQDKAVWIGAAGGVLPDVLLASSQFLQHFWGR